MDLQMPLLTVEGDKEPGLYQGVNDLQLLLAGMAGNVEALALFIDHVCALAVQLVDDPGNGFFVAGNGRCGDDDPIAGGDVHLLVGGECHAVQCGHILTLGTGGDDDQLVLRNALNGVQVHNGALLHFQIAKLLGDLEHILHAAAGDGHLPAIALGRGNDALNAVHIGGKGGDDDPLVAVAELPVQALGHHVFAGGIALALHIGRVGQQSQNALIAQFSKPGQIHHAVGRGGVDLEVTGHDHSAHRGLNGKGHGIRNGVVHMDEFHAEAACLDHVAGLVGNELHGVGEPMLFQL